MSLQGRSLFGTTWILAIMLAGTLSQAQRPDLPPGTIDGATTPQLIPDSTAFRLVFLSLRVPGSPSANDLKNQSSRLKHIGLSDEDAAAAKGIMSSFGTSYDAWQTKFGQPGSSIDVPTAKSEREAIVQETLGRVMKGLSPEGAAKLAEYVQAAKSRMVVHE
ncbi:hypothetical protein DYQ86_21390 [Acidobacteria bacterium AB60]|nr:hypothetical protein DYQ86_21390 [Acidobacteria bacterium AB60]